MCDNVWEGGREKTCVRRQVREGGSWWPGDYIILKVTSQQVWSPWGIILAGPSCSSATGADAYVTTHSSGLAGIKGKSRCGQPCLVQGISYRKALSTPQACVAAIILSHARKRSVTQPPLLLSHPPTHTYHWYGVGCLTFALHMNMKTLLHISFPVRMRDNLKVCS